jgi:hypothetical protein
MVTIGDLSRELEAREPPAHSGEVAEPAARLGYERQQEQQDRHDQDDHDQRQSTQRAPVEDDEGRDSHKNGKRCQLVAGNDRRKDHNHDQNQPRALPRMEINPEIRSLFDFAYEDFKLKGYDPHPAINARVAV